MVCLGSGGVLNDLDSALEEIKLLEQKGLLNNPPPGTSDIALREISLVKNFQGLEQYIQETETFADKLDTANYRLLFSLTLFIVIRIILGMLYKGKLLLNN